MILPGCPVHSGILKDYIWCCPADTDEDKKLDVWIVIRHGIYVGHALDVETADRTLGSVDRLDLLDWLDRMQKTALEWSNRYHALYRDLSDWVEYRDLPEEEKSPAEEAGEGKKTRFRHSFLLIRLPEEVRNDPDPLRRILERNRPDSEPDTGFFGW
jgi:hypothetical protein